MEAVGVKEEDQGGGRVAGLGPVAPDHPGEHVSVRAAGPVAHPEVDVALLLDAEGNDLVHD